MAGIPMRWWPVAVGLLALAGAMLRGAELPPEEAQRLRALCFRLGENEPGKKWDAARALINEGPKAVPIVGELFGGDWLEGKRMAAWILSEIRHESAVGPLAKALDDADEEVRWKAAVGLKQIGKPSVLHLVAALMAGPLPTKQCAAWTLGEIGDPDGAGPLAGALEEADEALRWKAAISLTQVGAASLPALTKVLKSQNVETRRCAIWAVGKIGGQAALPALAQALGDPDNHVRAKAVVALGDIPGEAATKLLLRMADDPDPIVRKDAIVALGRRGKALDPAALPDRPAKEPTTKIPLYSLWEIEFRPKQAPKLANPFTDAAVSAVFVAPDDRNIRIHGFYAGDGTWKVRATPDLVGVWYYRVDFKAGDVAEMATGGAKCVAAKAPGFLRIAKDTPRFLAYSDGTRFYPIGAGTTFLGDPAADGTPTSTLDVWKTYLDDCAKSGMNRCRIVLPEAPWVGLEVVQRHPELAAWALDGPRYDLARFSLPFWDKLDAVIAHGATLGISFELTVFDETGLASENGNPWPLHPFNAKNGGPIGGLSGCPGLYDLSVAANRTAQEAYVRYLLARTVAFTNVTYELNNQMDRRGSASRLGVPWAEHWAAFFREFDPYDHLVALNVVTRPEGYFLIGGIDIANVHGNTPPEAQGIRMPVFLNETYAKTPQAERAIFWQALLVGTSAARAPWQRLTARSPAFEHCRDLAEFARDVPYWAMKHDDSVVLSTPRNVARVAAAAEGEILVYLMGAAEDGSIRIGVANGRYEATWFDPKNGRTIRSDTVEAAQGALDLPSPTFAEDIVLRIRKK